MAKTQPIGIELVKRNVVTEDDVSRALDYQKQHPNEKLGDIIKTLELCDPNILIKAIGEILGEKVVNLTVNDIKIDVLQYIPIDLAKRYKAIPFEVGGGRIKVCFADTNNKRNIESMRVMYLNKGLIMEQYITFESNIRTVLQSFESSTTEDIDTNVNITGLLDTIIRSAMEKRASDIHIEPMEDSIRIRYRIDGKLTTITTLEKEKQPQLIGRLKAISNMHQEKQESQDGRILMYPDYNIRVSSQPNVYGEKFVLRLLKKNNDVQKIFELGFPGDENSVKKYFDKRNSIMVIAAPTGEGKTTTLYSIIDFLNKPEINVTTIEDPVEIRIPGLNQIEIDAKSSFSGSLRTVLRQDPDIILVGEIRDTETAEIAMQAGQTGHYVLSTIHTIDSIEVITRLRKMKISDYDISSTLATSVSQRLVRRVCKDCAVKREYTEEEKEMMNKIVSKYDMTIDFSDKYTYNAVGCEKCNGTGYYGRIGIFEVLSITDEIKELIGNSASTIEIRRKALEQGYRPLIVDGVKKVLNGVTTLEELNSKLAIF